jgi:hypothetical protein
LQGRELPPPDGALLCSTVNLALSPALSEVEGVVEGSSP